ncbi:MAG: hypothetical protein WC760_06495 [Bacteroidia bacterium]|jgi:hypothetical protein
MALSIIKSPAAVVASRNPVKYTVETDAFVTTAGVKAELTLVFTAQPPDGITFTLEFMGREEVFAFTDNPALASGYNKILIDDDYVVLADWIQYEVIKTLSENPYIALNFTLVPGTYSGNPGVKFIARENGIAYNINGVEAHDDIGFLGSISGIDQEYAENFRILCDVFQEQTFGQDDPKPVFNAEGIPNNTDQCTFYLEPVLDGLLKYDIPEFVSASFQQLAAQFTRFFVMFSEFYGTVPSAGRYKQSPAQIDSVNQYISVIKGAEKFTKAIAETLVSDYVTPDLVKFLTSMPRKITVDRTQHQYLSFWYDAALETSVKLRIQVRFYYAGDTVGEWLTVDELTSTDFAGRITTIPAGFGQLNLIELTDLEKEIMAYDIRVAKVIDDVATAVTETMRFELDRNIVRDPHYFLFINSFGCPEVVYFTGNQKRSAQAENSAVRMAFVDNDPDTGIVNGEIQEVNNEWQTTYELNSGPRTRDSLRYLMDFINSPKRFVQLADSYSQVNIPKGKIELDEDNDTLFTCKISLSDAWIERGNG